MKYSKRTLFILLGAMMVGCFAGVIAGCGGDANGNSLFDYGACDRAIFGTSCDSGLLFGCSGCERDDRCRHNVEYFYEVFADRDEGVYYEDYTLTDTFSHKKNENVELIEPRGVNGLFAGSLEDDYIEFVGFFKDSAHTVQLTDSAGNWTYKKKLEDGQTLYGYYKEKYKGEPRTLTFSLPEIAEPYGEVDSVTLTVGAPIQNDLPEAPEVPGYKFDGWKIGSNVISLNAGQKFHLYEVGTVQQFITLTASYSPATYSVIFRMKENDKVMEDISYGTKFSDLITRLSDSFLQDDGGKVTGWSYDEDGENPVQANDVVTKDVTLYAIYQKYVTLTLHGYYGPDDERMYTTRELEGDWYRAPWPASTERDVFEGWYYDENHTRVAVETQGSYMKVESDKNVLYGKWRKVDNFEIRFYQKKGELNPLRILGYTYSESESIPLSYQADPEDYGYEFEGWCFDPDLKDDPITQLPAGTYGNIALYAKFKPQIFTIWLNAVNGKLPDGESLGTWQVAYGGGFSLPVPTLENHDFDGWFFNGTTRVTDGNGESVIDFTCEGFGVNKFDNITFIARYKLKQFTLKFVVVDDGLLTTYAEITCEYGKTPELPEKMNSAPTRTGHTFEGWFAGNDEKFEPSDPVEGNVTYIARFTANTYTIYLHTSEDTGEYTETEIQFGTAISLGVPVREGYVFLGWKDEDGNYIAMGNGVMMAPYNMDGDLHLYADWQEI